MLLYFFVLTMQGSLALPERLSLIENYTYTTAAHCGSIERSKIQDFIRDKIDNYIDTRYGPICNCGGPSWTKLVDLDLSDTTQTCPTSNWRLVSTSSVRACGRTAAGCQSATFPARGKSYTRVCGQVNGIQFGNPDGFGLNIGGIEGVYVDGVSITHGSPRQHIWTFVGYVGAHFAAPHSWCPCSNINRQGTTPIPTFVGNNYFCDTGNFANTYHPIYYSDHQLWDGEGCSSISTCCQFNNPPWFCTSLPDSTDDLEVRICGDETTATEDTLITKLELYVK